MECIEWEENDPKNWIHSDNIIAVNCLLSCKDKEKLAIRNNSKKIGKNTK